jgi:hypothetical protein
VVILVVVELVSVVSSVKESEISSAPGLPELEMRGRAKLGIEIFAKYRWSVFLLMFVVSIVVGVSVDGVFMVSIVVGVSWWLWGGSSSSC